MKAPPPPTPFALGAQSFSASLPSPCQIDEEDVSLSIKIPGWRYDAIDQTVLKMYEKTDARVFPLPVFDIANRLDCSVIPYRSFGKQIHDALLDVSTDAFLGQFWGNIRPVILYNDRQPSTRINFSILHEIGHLELGHKEPSQLAEKEANHFAAVALCPIDLLDHYRISDPHQASDIFNISEECARNRLKALNRSRQKRPSDSRIDFRRKLIERFSLNRPIQINLQGI